MSVNAAQLSDLQQRIDILDKGVLLARQISISLLFLSILGMITGTMGIDFCSPSFHNTYALATLGGVSGGSLIIYLAVAKVKRELKKCKKALEMEKRTQQASRYPILPEKEKFKNIKIDEDRDPPLAPPSSRVVITKIRA